MPVNLLDMLSVCTAAVVGAGHLHIIMPFNVWIKRIKELFEK